MNVSFEQRLAGKYETLSSRLREAGEYVLTHPVDLASKSLRVVASESGVAPATFSRLARALDYANIEDMRDAMRRKISNRINNFAERAEKLQTEHGRGESAFYPAHVEACLNNIDQMGQQIDLPLLESTADRLHGARSVILLGGLGSSGIVEYLAYMADFCMDNWRLAGRTGTSLGGAISDLGPEDAMIVVTKPPFSGRVLRAAKTAHEQGVFVVIVTDTHACPALRHCSAGFIVPTDSPHFYSSYAATFVLIEAMIGMVVSRAGPDARARIARVEESNRRLSEVLDGLRN